MASAPKDSSSEADRANALLDAQNKAALFFEEIARTLIRAGIGEKQLSDEIHKLGQERHSIKTHWHKRIIRSGPNTLRPYEDNPPDRIIQPGDILIVDLGPVFEQWEADFGRSYIVPAESQNLDEASLQEKKRLVDALEPMWLKAQAEFRKDPTMSASALFKLVVSMAEDGGWIWGAPLAGHIIGDFPHERIPKDKITNYIIAENKQSIESKDKRGNKLHWILEIYLRPQNQEYCGFFEQILTI